MKSQAFFLVALLVLAFATTAYAESTEVRNLKDISITCMQDIYEGVQLCMKFYRAIVDNDLVILIGLVSQAQALYKKVCVDCFEEVLKFIQ